MTKGIYVSLAVATFIVLVAWGAVSYGYKASDIALIGFIAFGSIIILFATAVLYQIGNEKISLTGIISEPSGTLTDKPTASRKPRCRGFSSWSSPSLWPGCS